MIISTICDKKICVVWIAKQIIACIILSSVPLTIRTQWLELRQWNDEKRVNSHFGPQFR